MIKTLKICIGIVVLVSITGCLGSQKKRLRPNLSELTPRQLLGHSLTVYLDGQQTRPVPDSDPPAWTVDPLGGNPTLLFEVDQAAFQLPLKSVNITICPVKEGKIDEMIVYRPTDIPTRPSQNVQMQSFEYADQSEYRKIEALPAGSYQMRLHVIGNQFRDRQVISLIVK